MSRPENEIIFEDLHGSREDENVTIDLDADDKSAGIERTPAGQAAGDGAGNDDDIEVVITPGADKSAAGAGGDDEIASTVSDDDDYSKKVKARIQRATRATSKKRKRGDYWENQARQLAKDNYESEKQAAENIIERADTQLENTQDQLEKAIEDGKTKDQVRLTTQLTDQKAAKVRAEVTLENLSPDGNVQPFSDRVADRTSENQSKADDWMDGHDDWYGVKGFERQTRLAVRLDKEVFKDGYDPDTEEYFTELDRRMKEKEPKLYEDLDVDPDDVDDPADKRPTRRSPVAPVDRQASRRQTANSGKVELNEDDFANMRRFNLDVNDPDVLKEYARNKREQAQGEKS